MKFFRWLFRIREHTIIVDRFPRSLLEMLLWMFNEGESTGWERDGLKRIDRRNAAVQAARAFEKAETRLNKEYVELLQSARAIAERKGVDVAWARFANSIAAMGITGVTARVYKLDMREAGHASKVHSFAGFQIVENAEVPNGEIWIYDKSKLTTSLGGTS